MPKRLIFCVEVRLRIFKATGMTLHRNAPNDDDDDDDGLM